MQTKTKTNNKQTKKLQNLPAGSLNGFCIMYFTLRFFAGNYRDSWKMTGIFEGVENYNEVTELTDTPKLDPQKIDRKIYNYDRRDYEVDLTIDQARECGHFAETEYFTIKVPEHFLNDYVNLIHEIEKNKETGEIIKVSHRYEFNFEKFWEDWESMGFPEKIEV